MYHPAHVTGLVPSDYAENQTIAVRYAKHMGLMPCLRTPFVKCGHRIMARSVTAIGFSATFWKRSKKPATIETRLLCCLPITETMRVIMGLLRMVEWA